MFCSRIFLLCIPLKYNYAISSTDIRHSVSYLNQYRDFVDGRRIYEMCPESKDTKVLNMWNIFNLQKQHCEWIAST